MGSRCQLENADINSNSVPVSAPDGIPENILLGGTTSTSCFLLWDAAENSIEDPDGAILGHYIYYRKDGSSDSFAKIDVQGEDMTDFDVEGLQEYTGYEFHIVAYNYYGEGNASDVFKCFTDEDGRCNSHN